MKDYHDFYLQVDLYCWLVCSKRLQKKPQNYFEYGPANGYSGNAMLRFTDVNLKLISDIEKYQFPERTIGVVFL